ncbi:putative MFS transporter [Aeropyrum pernix K1]|uniref:MFS transporter n=1 Tax=Aeropyrum pernix (strain ATCC 700893 / DSM 11879 / JCM 9820 / NBRC 100138 / K1) TaxID=272557 RepID=Q9Y9L9_AERPE|nr:MFS transporter [Aeropyrum pernix]BAA81281.2 putative MFS transporter [Aeropyrum pernix K1]
MRRSLLLAGLALSVFSSQAIWVTYSPVTSLVAEDLDVSKEEVGLLAIVYPAAFLALTIPSGVLLDRAFRTWLTVGVLLTGAAGVLRLLDPLSYEWLLACQVLAALGQPLLLNSFAPAASTIRPERRDTVVSLLSFAMYLGIIYALGTGYYIYTRLGLQWLNIPIAAVSAASVILYVAGLPALPQQAGSGLGFKDVVSEFRLLAGRRDLWLLGLILGLGVALFDNMSIWLEAALSPKGLGDIAGSSVALALLAGLVGVAVIPPRVVRVGLRSWYIRAAALLVAVLYLALALETSRLAVQTLIPLAGLVMLPAYPVIMEWISTYYDKRLQGKAAGAIGFVSRILTVSLASAATLFLSSPSAYFTFLAVLSTIAFAIALLLPSDR